jgi:hypothetical protein
MFSSPRVKYALACSFGAWSLVVGLGFLLLGAYAARPGNAGAPPVSWPAASLVRLDDGRSNLLFFLHPRCPCSRASLAELAWIMSRCGDKVSAHALLLRPERLPREWGESGIEPDSVKVPNLAVMQDDQGAEARRFRVATSGHVLLYDSRGRLTFSGGITAARGHQGGNYGRDAVVAAIEGEKAGRSKNPVFGCPLGTPGARTSEEPPR